MVVIPVIERSWFGGSPCSSEDDWWNLLWRVAEHWKNPQIQRQSEISFKIRCCLSKWIRTGQSDTLFELELAFNQNRSSKHSIPGSNRPNCIRDMINFCIISPLCWCDYQMSNTGLEVEL